MVDEVVVVDDGSTDATAAVAAAAGAVVVAASSVLPECGPGTGKGEALWKALYVATGDVLVFCDADLTDFDPAFVTGLLGPLLLEPFTGAPGVGFVKGHYDRPVGGGRVTELVARPLLGLFFPELLPIRQPLGGEFAARREVLERVPFVQGYGVDLGLLVDVAARFGPESIAQIDLGTRTHRNRSLDELGHQATAVLRVALRRAGVPDRPGWGDADVAERPPIDRGRVLPGQALGHDRRHAVHGGAVGGVDAEALDEGRPARRLSGRGGRPVRVDVAGHDQHRHARLRRQGQDAADGLAVERAGVERALAGDDEVGAGDPLGQPSASATTSKPGTSSAPAAASPPASPPAAPEPGMSRTSTP